MTPTQQKRLDALFAALLPRNAFYARKLAGCDLSAFAHLPFTTKDDLVTDQIAHPPYGSNLTYPPDRYVRLHQTSGTSGGRPLRWLDTTESWDWLVGCWETKFRIAGIAPTDRLFFAFSFGPFLGFWTAFAAGQRLGCFVLPGGGLSSAARLRLILDNAISVVLCTPTYALRLAEVARDEKLDLVTSPVRALIVAGEPGGSIPATRARIETAWGARVFDHSGLTEVGPVTAECVAAPLGLHVLEDDYIAEIIDPKTTEPLPPGEVGELVLTNLGRVGSPLLRYRTGDLVRADPNQCRCGSPFLRLSGGILGRADEMIHVRGNNVYPSALEGLLRRFDDVTEYRLVVDGTASLRIEVEGDVPLAERVGRAVRDAFNFRPEVIAVPPNSLPRFEMKAKRLTTETQRHREEKKENI